MYHRARVPVTCDGAECESRLLVAAQSAGLDADHLGALAHFYGVLSKAFRGEWLPQEVAYALSAAGDDEIEALVEFDRVTSPPVDEAIRAIEDAAGYGLSDGQKVHAYVRHVLRLMREQRAPAGEAA